MNSPTTIKTLNTRIRAILDRWLPDGIDNASAILRLVSFQSPVDRADQDVLDPDHEYRAVLHGQVWSWIQGHGWSWSGPVSDFGCSDCGVLLPDGEVYCEECNERFEWRERQAVAGNFAAARGF